MSESLPFTKYVACGNDFLVTEGPLRPTAQRARRLCHRHRGVGADGWIHLREGSRDMHLILFNADGSEAGFSGNGFRAAAVHLAKGERGAEFEFVCRRRRFRAGLRDGEPWVFHPVDGRPPARPIRPPSSMPQSWEKALEGTYLVRLGNPHLVFLGRKLPHGLGPFCERWARGLPEHPDGINVSWLLPEDAGWSMRTWERGVGATASCASAALAAACIPPLAESSHPLRIHHPGGAFVIRRSEDGLELQGPVEKVFVGHVDLGRPRRSHVRSRRSDEA